MGIQWTHAEYDQDKSRTRSTSLKNIISAQGPRLYLLALRRDLEDQDAANPKVDDKVLGILLHEYILENRQNWFICDKRYGSKAWIEESAEQLGKWAVKTSQHDAIMRWAESIQGNSQAREIIEGGGFAEHVFLWADEGTDIPCKARVDLYAHDGTIVDIKTTRHADRDKFDKQLRDLRYDFSAAFYERGRCAETKIDRANFLHIVVSKEWPYSCYVWPLDESYRRVGHRDVDTALHRLRRCLDDEERIVAEGGEALDAWPDLQALQQGDDLAAPDWWLSKLGFNPDEW